MGTANLTLELTTAAGADLNDFVRIELFSIQGSQHYQSNVQVKRTVTIQGIEVNPFGPYRVQVMPTNYRIVQRIQMLRDGQTAKADPLACPVLPSRVARIQAPAFESLQAPLQTILRGSQIPRFLDPQGRFVTGPALYSRFGESPRLQACLLNIAAKSEKTILRDGKSCLDHYAGLIRIEQDRLFIRTTAALFEEAGNSPLFHPADSSLHDPVPGFANVGSFKTFDRAGNLQLTFQRNGAGDYIADVDIDAAQGVRHVFEVLKDMVTGPTDPYDIHDILIKEQSEDGVDPNYTFVFPKTATVVAGTT